MHFKPSYLIEQVKLLSVFCLKTCSIHAQKLLLGELDERTSAHSDELAVLLGFAFLIATVVLLKHGAHKLWLKVFARFVSLE